MKKITTLLVLVFAVFSLQAQNSDIDTPLDNFDELNVRGVVNVHYTQGGEPHLKCTVSEKDVNSFTYKVENSVLYLSTKKISTSVDVYISSPVLKKVDLGSASSFNSEGSIKGNAIQFFTSGATNLDVTVDCEILELNAEGAADVKFAGKAAVMKCKAEGACSVNALKLETNETDITASGASDVKVQAGKSLKVHAEGASDVTYSGNPEEVEIELEGIASVNDKTASEGNMSDDNDTLSIGHKEIIIKDDDEDVADSGADFDGHWGGIDFAFCGFLNSSNELNSTVPAYNFMETDLSHSWGIHLNIIEQNFNLIRNHVGLVTGLGFHINNYRLDGTTRLISDSATLMSWSDTLNSTIRSKFVTSYLILPLMLEYQTNNNNNKNSFHLGVGGFVGTRLSSHTKVTIDKGNGKDKMQSFDKFHLNPIKYGLMARIGWGHLNFFANYSLSTMFENNEGPEVYPLEFGLTIVGW